MDTCVRCGKKLGFLERRTGSVMFRNALRYGLFLEYGDKETCLSCKHELLDSERISYRGRKGRKQGLARIKELAKTQNLNPVAASYSYWRIISSIGYIFGGLLVLLGVYAYLYYETDYIGWLGLAYYSYRNYAIPLIIVGIALLITGEYGLRQHKKRAIRK